jgi:HTH-type transcriptional regulator/antitoxin HigA
MVMIKEFLSDQGLNTRRFEEMGALAIDDRKFARMLAEVENLMDKGERRTPGQDAALDLMVRLIQDYEEEHHPLPDPSPTEMLAYLMEQRGLKQADLVHVFKSRGYVSDVLNGKRAISKALAKQLASIFNVSVNVFI